MKNRIKELNTVIAYTDIHLVKKNIVSIYLNNSNKYIAVRLTSSKMKLFWKYGLNKLVNKNNNNVEILDRNIILKDIKNFRKYYNDYSFTLDLEQIKKIYINNNISLELLYKYVDSLDYLWLNDLDENILHSGINIEKNKYYNILVDLKTESIPKEILYDYPICLLFKFFISKSGHLIQLTEVGKLDRFSIMLAKLEKKGYITRKYYNIDDILDLQSLYVIKKRDYYEYNGYCGNFETYFSFKALLRGYLEGINIYYYKDNYYTYDQLQKAYDIKSLEHSKFINDNLLDYSDNTDKVFEDIIKYHPEVIKISCKCIDVEEPMIGDYEQRRSFMHPLSKLRILFRPISINGENKNKKHYRIICNLYNLCYSNTNIINFKINNRNTYNNNICN